MIEPEVVFNMDLANAPTTVRFCYAAAAVLGQEISPEDEEILTAYENHDYDAGEFAPEIADEWTTRLESAGYAVLWDCGDVVVWDLRPLSEDDRETFLEEMWR